MSIISRMSSYDDDIDFRKVWKVGTTISLLVLVTSLAGIFGRGLNLGLDFEGGSSWDVPTADLSVEDVRDTLAEHGEEGAKVQVIGRGDSRTVRVQTDVEDPEVQADISESLAAAAGLEVADITVSTVGPSWGEQLTDKAIRALIWFFIVITAYIAWRLEWKMAVGALASVAHDLVISVGFYALFQIEITPATVIAFLTILGYSLYDTIVVFDRMQDNGESVGATGKVTYTGIASLSLNQVLMRSVNSTISSLLPVIAMLVVGSTIMGAAALQEFALALTVGIVIGAFSSILIATPVTVWLKEREPRYREIRARVSGRGGPVLDPVPAAGPAAKPVASAPKRSVTPGQAPSLSGRPIPPRPRKKGKRR
ncbi:MAG: protein translocase subunit SecF [Actinomycetota bacterium]